MQIRTPKRYRSAPRRSIIGCRRLLFWLTMLLLIGGGIALLLNRERVAPVLQQTLLELVDELEAQVATLSLPEPTATADPSNQLIQADNYWQQGALSAAAAIYQELALDLPNSSEIYRRIALSAIQSGNYDAALEAAQRAIDADPFSADAWAIQAWSLDWSGQPAAALANAIHALELAPSHARARAYLAEIYLSLGQGERGESLLQSLLEEQPDSAEAYRARGLYQQLLRYDYDAARQDFQTAYDLARHMNGYAIDIAILESNLRNHSTALDYLSDVIESDPRNERALLLLGRGQWSANGNPAQAQRYLQDCVDYNADNLNCTFWLGYMQYRLSQFDAAAQSFTRAIDLGSENPQHYYWAGEVQIVLGNCSRALSYLQPGLQLAQQGGYTQFASDIEAVIPQCDPTFRSSASDG